MTIKNQKNWILRRYFIPCMSLYGIIYCQYIFPIESRGDLIEKILLCLLIIALSAIGVVIIEKMTDKKITVDEYCLIVKSMLKKRKYNLRDLKEIEYEKLIRTRSGHFGNQLKFKAGGKKYILDSTEFDDLDEFVCFLQKQVDIKIS